MTWKFHWAPMHRFDPFGSPGLFIGHRGMSRRFYIAAPLTMVPVPEGTGVDKPTIEFPDGDHQQFQQAMMDSLWEQGVRPSEHKITALATEKHLADMRAIVFKKLEVEQPK